jgi:hypothetical protein
MEDSMGLETRREKGKMGRFTSSKSSTPVVEIATFEVLEITPLPASANASGYEKCAA